ncbi:MAG: hypothetical protein AAF587_05355 [Bacteroidota bacterium]
MKPFTHILEPDLEQLIRQKAFSDLSLEEKAIVLTEVSEREYTRLREFTLTTQAYFRQTDLPLAPRAETRQILLNRMAQKKQSKVKGLIRRMVNYPVPAWQVAASMGLLVIALYFGQNHPMIQPDKGGPNHIIVDSAHVDSALRPHFHPNEDTMVHLTTMVREGEVEKASESERKEIQEEKISRERKSVFRSPPKTYPVLRSVQARMT